MSPIRQVYRKTFHRARWCSAAWFAIVMPTIFAVATGAQTTPVQQPLTCPSEIRTLTADELVRCHMDAGATHVYQLDLAAGQSAQILLEQKGVDVELKVFAPDQTLFITIDNPNGFYGQETAAIVAPTGGRFRIEVSSDKSYPPGDYELKVVGPRAMTAADEQQVQAGRLFAEAQQLRYDAAQKTRDDAIATYNAALKKYGEALAISLSLGDLRGQGYALTNTGRVYKILGQRERAIECLTGALVVLRKANDVSAQAFVLNELGAVHRDLGNARDALTCYDDALKLRLELGDRYGQAQLYNNLGLTYSNIGYQRQAVANLETAAQIWNELKMYSSEVNTLINAAKANAERGYPDLALGQYQKVDSFADELLSKNDPALKRSANTLKAFALNGIGLVYDTWADSENALKNYKESRELFHSNGQQQYEADVLDNIGLLHAFLGDPANAKNYFQESLEIREQYKSPKPLGMTLSNMGYAAMLLGKDDEALTQLQLALPQLQQAGDRRFEAYTLVWLGMLHRTSNPEKALDYYNQALAIQQDPQFEDRRGVAITLDKMGEALARSHQWKQALNRYEQAIASWTEVADEQGRALSLYGIAKVESEQGNLANAADRIEEAIRTVEKLRHKVTGRQLQMTYFAAKQDLYALAIDVRVQLSKLAKSPADRDDNIAAALSLAERSRARNLLDLLTQALRVRGTSTNDTNSGLREPQPLAAREIQKLLDDDTVLVEYFLDDVRSHVWTVTRNTIDHQFLPGRTETEKAANDFRVALTANEPQRKTETNSQYLERWRIAPAPEQYRRVAFNLSHILLDSIRPQLVNKRLVIVADGALQYIPFQALPLPESTFAADRARPRTLLETNEILYEPSASTLALLRTTRRPAATKPVAVIADPVFSKDEARVRGPATAKDIAPLAHAAKENLARSLRDIGDTAQSGNLPRLEYSRKEANAIIRIAPRGSWMAVGFKANRATVTSPFLKQFNTVHFATHGILNDKDPELSGIVLSMVNEKGQLQDGYLTLRDIYKLDLPVHLVVVSACQSGIGQWVRGEGLIGLTRGFMYAGAEKLVVSLWLVDDQATAELMKRFYQHMLGKENLPAAAALRQAQLEMQADRRWHDPYYWAGFVLQGDWK